MARCNIEFGFSVGDKVLIEVNGITGTIKGLHIDKEFLKWAGVEFATRDGQIQYQWLRESEISPAT